MNGRWCRRTVKVLLALALHSWLTTDSDSLTLARSSKLTCQITGTCLGTSAIWDNGRSESSWRRHGFFNIIVLGCISSWHISDGSLSHSSIQATFIELLQYVSLRWILRSQRCVRHIPRPGGDNSTLAPDETAKTKIAYSHQLSLQGK